MSSDTTASTETVVGQLKPRPLNHRLLHRSPLRDEFYKSSDPLRWSEDLDCWMLFDPEAVIAVLKSEKFQVVDYESEAMKIVDGLGVDLQATTKVIRHLPVAQEGCPHVALRRQMAVHLSDKPQNALLEVDSHLQHQIPLVFGRDGEVDVVAELFAPLADKLVSQMSGIRSTQELGGVSPSQLFDKVLSVNRRKVIERKLREIYDRVDAASGSDIAGIQVALVVLGADAMLGSLGESFLLTVRANPGKMLSEMSWSRNIPATGVPYLDRVACETTTICGREVKSGECVRVYLDALRHARPDLQEAYFGAGRHTCLGRAVAQKVWQKVALGLGSVRRRVAIRSVAYRPSDYVFNCPISIRVSVE